jgi:Protein of unknown function DUF262
MSAIFDNIAQVTGLKTPATTAEITSFIRKANKKTANPKIHVKLSAEAKEYLAAAFCCLRAQTLIPPPFDFVERSNNGMGEDEDAFEPAPEGLHCLPTHTIYNLLTLISMREQEQIKLPDFQRKFIWNKESKQGFLRSLLSGIPTTNILFAVDEATEDRYILDGFQRLSTLVDFKNGKETLGPGAIYANFTFAYLPVEEQNKFLHKTIVVQEVRSDRKFWPYIFRQINKGGVPLNDMEIKRATYQHEYIFMLDRFTETNEWWSGLFGRNTRYKGLQALLRALAMHNDYLLYTKPMYQFLDRFCDKLFIDVCHDKDIKKLEIRLNLLFKLLYSNIGKLSFRLAEKKPVNLGLLDTVVHGGLLLLEKEKEISYDELGVKLKEMRESLLKLPKVVSSLTLDTSGRDSVQTRMSSIEDLI